MKTALVEIILAHVSCRICAQIKNLFVFFTFSIRLAVFYLQLVKVCVVKHYSFFAGKSCFYFFYVLRFSKVAEKKSQENAITVFVYFFHFFAVSKSP